MRNKIQLFIALLLLSLPACTLTVPATDPEAEPTTTVAEAIPTGIDTTVVRPGVDMGTLTIIRVKYHKMRQLGSAQRVDGRCAPQWFPTL